MFTSIQKSILILLLSFSYPLSAQLGPYYQQRIAYRINVDVDAKDYRYKGHQKITYQNNSPDTLTRFYIHLYWNAFQPGSMADQRAQALGKEAIPGSFTNLDTEESPIWKTKISTLKEKEYGQQKIRSLKQNGIPLEYEISGTILEIRLAQPIPPKSSSTFDMEWEAQIPAFIRRAGRNNPEGIALSMAQWYPKVAAYDYEGWHADEYISREFYGVFGDFDVTINIDKDYVVGAGGILQNPKEVKGYGYNTPKIIDGKTKWHFKAENIHDFAWAADPDFTVEQDAVPNGPAIYYIYRKNEKTRHWKAFKPYIKRFYEEMAHEFGRYPYPTYSFIQAGDGGMEYGMCTLLKGETEPNENLDRHLNMWFHEAAHSWFQHIIATNETNRAWMDEGFTSYATSRVLEKIFRSGNLIKSMDFFGPKTYTAFRPPEEEEPMSLFSEHFHTTKAYVYASYDKPEIGLYQLGYIVGRENLHKIFRQYFDTWKFRHPTERDFIHIAQKVSGMNLQWYFNLWVNTTYTIDYAIETVNTDVDRTEITLKRKGRIPMPIDLYITYEDGSQEIHYIPLSTMRGEKANETPEIKRTTLPDWGWTQENYSFKFPHPKKNIKNIILDASFRLADVNYEDNIWPKKQNRF